MVQLNPDIRSKFFANLRHSHDIGPIDKFLYLVLLKLYKKALILSHKYAFFTNEIMLNFPFTVIDDSINLMDIKILMIIIQNEGRFKY